MTVEAATEEQRLHWSALAAGSCLLAGFEALDFDVRVAYFVELPSTAAISPDTFARKSSGKTSC